MLREFVAPASPLELSDYTRNRIHPARSASLASLTEEDARHRVGFSTWIRHVHRKSGQAFGARKIRAVRAADPTNEVLAATLFVNLRLPIAPQRQTV
jgi:hypothetical protein